MEWFWFWMNNAPDLIRQFWRTVYPFRLSFWDSLCTAAPSPHKLVPRAFPSKNWWPHPFFEGKALGTRLLPSEKIEGVSVWEGRLYKGQSQTDNLLPALVLKRPIKKFPCPVFLMIAKDCTERLSAVGLSIGLIIPRGLCFSGHVVRASFFLR